MSEKDDKPNELAVALSYDGYTTPRITAKGSGDTAREIIALAEAHGVPLEEDAELAALLAQLPLGDEIPELLYRAVAEVIAFAWILSGKRPPGFRETDPES